MCIAAIDSSAQSLSNYRIKTIELNSDTIQIDTLSIVPGSFSIQGIDSAVYQVLYPDGKLILSQSFQKKSQVTYRVFPFNFTKKIKHRSLNKNKNGISYNPFTIKRGKLNNNLLNDNSLEKRGSISRGLNFGNTRDLSVSSNMNLQLAGKIQDIEIAASITDNNIPIQPEGNTQQLQDFDEVYVQFKKDSNELIAGDYQFQEKTDEFLRFNKKAQGLNYKGQFKLDKTGQKKLNVDVGAAISRGKFGRNLINGAEGNQGPYLLTGSENERFIIVLSGTEKVFIDGKLLTRGMDNDYVIDYNTAEITFTNNQLVTKDKRIIVEFQYSDRNFTRTLYSVRNDLTIKKNTVISFKVYSEQDMKSESLLQILTDEDKEILSQAGDSLHEAVASKIDSVEFSSNLVLYEKIDSTVDGIIYPSIYLHSTDPEKAFYKLSFSNVGQNKGHYIQEVSSLNGRVYSWVAPINGIPQGQYMPVITLVSPKQRQMATISITHQFNKYHQLFIEGALSNKNNNLFSKKDKQDDQGVALKTDYSFSSPIFSDDLGWKIEGKQSYRLISKNFNAIERFRSVEFERDWNASLEDLDKNEHWIALLLQLKKKGLIKTKINTSVIDRGASYQGLKNDLGINFNLWSGATIDGTGSFLNTKGTVINSQFLRHVVNLNQQLGKVNLKLWEQQENKLLRQLASDSLLSTSTNDNYNLFGALIGTGDKGNLQLNASYSHRYDYLPNGNALKLVTTADDYGVNFLHQNNNKTSILKFKSSLRQLQIKDSLLSVNQAENTVLNRVEYSFSLLKGMIRSKSFFEIGTGNELKREFTYIAVNPGQGLYIWIDHNNDGVQQLNEFETPLQNTDQPDFLRVFLPSTEYIKTYTNQLTQSLNFNPAKYYKRNNGLKRLITRFSDQAYLRLNQKNAKDQGEIVSLPFANSIQDSGLISINSSFRNTIFFNRSNPIFGANFSVKDNRNKNLLLHGYDARRLYAKTANLRYNLLKVITIQLKGELQEKSRSSEVFSNDDFLVNSKIIEPKIQFQKNSKFRFTLLGAYKDKKNEESLGGEHSVFQKIGWIFNYAIPGKGRLNLEFDYIKTSFLGADLSSSPLQFELLEGLQIGTNFTWSLRFQQSFKNNLQANITYNGRSSPGFKVVHTGGLQVQLLF